MNRKDLDTLHAKGMEAFLQGLEEEKVTHSNGYTISEVEDEKWGRLFIIKELDRAWLTLDLALVDVKARPAR